MIDPRVSGACDRLRDVRRILAVTGGKGGIGKSAIASLLALALGERGATGLLDLDLTGPTDHLFLGAPIGFPEEEFGVDPSTHAGIAFMSIAHFGGATPAPLRGTAITDALLELLAITNWGALDTLVLDMPPGIGDTALDAIRWIDRAEYIVVATPSVIVRETVRRTLTLLRALGARVAGVVENMQRAESPDVRELAQDFDVPLLGSLAWDDSLENALGNVAQIRELPLFASVRRVADRLGP